MKKIHQPVAPWYV